MSSSPPTTPSALSVFRNRNFALLWGAQLVSTIGSALTSLAASILIYQQTESTLSVGLMLMAGAAPSLIFGLIAGVFVDRADRKRIMLGADIVRGLLVFMVPFLLGPNHENSWWLFVIVFLTSSVGQFFDPAQSSVLPEVASDEELAAANSLMAISSFGATAVGFAASGLLATIDINWAFWADGLTFLLSAALILLVRVPHNKLEEATRISTIFKNMFGGLEFLFRTPVLRSLFVLMPFMGVAFGLSNTLLLPFATKILGAGEFEYGIQEGLTSLGFVAGSLLMARLADRRPAGQWLVFSYLGMGASQMLYSQLSIIPIAFAVITVSGFMNAPSVVARNLIIQRHTPREMRGRVASVFFVTRDLSFLIGMVSAGLADAIGIRELFFAAAAMVAVMGVVALFMPGVGQATFEWRRAVQTLRAAQAAPPARLSAGRAATVADVGMLAAQTSMLATLTPTDRQQLAASSRVVDAPPGTIIIRRGDASNAAYFLLKGRVVAGVETSDGQYRSLEEMSAGDFFGEIAALSGQPRTANVVAVEPVQLFEVPASALRQLMAHPRIGELVRAKYVERLSRTNLTELPRFAGVDQATVRELRLEPATVTG
jgi:CRP-like cAMP-binding protein/predicted MFS family arabinose efflux permease